MPIPFTESFVFNWGSFAGQPAKVVAFWYQNPPVQEEANRELVYTLTGPFALDTIDELTPAAPFPLTVQPTGNGSLPTQSWTKSAQQGFVDLCHVHRRYVRPVPPSGGSIPDEICLCAETRLWVARQVNSMIHLGCDDPIRLYLNGTLLFSDNGGNQSDPFKLFKIQAVLREGVNTIRVVVGNTENTNWRWNGFSLVIENNLKAGELCCLTDVK